MSERELHVVFGAGQAGLAVADALVARGRRVRVVNRSGKASVLAGVEVCRGDATDPSVTTQLAAGATVVYSCLNAPYDKWPELLPPLQRGVLAGAARAGAKLVALENLYMYGPTGGAPLTEDLPYAATGRKGRVRAAMAAELLEAHRRGDVRVAIGRASDFFGPRVLTSAMGDRIFPKVLAGKAAQVTGDPDLPHTYTYMPDIGRGLALLGERGEADGRAWHLPSPETVSTRAFIAAIGAEAGQPPHLQVVPAFLLRVVGLFNPVVRELGETRYQFAAPFIVDDSAFTRAFGMRATPLEAATRETMAWYRTAAMVPAVPAHGHA